MLTSFLYTCLSLTSLSLVNAQWPVDDSAATVREIEHLYLDSASHNLKSMITPCSNYIDSSTGAQNGKLGRQTAAEWIRVAFHDFVTANIYVQSGGLDASIGFETDRGENIGTAFNDALINFSYYFNSRVSMADLIALGTALASAHCGGNAVRMRGGRKDATEAGPKGVPQPQEDLSTQLLEFGNAGFNRDDTIALTACGHTLGGVHKNIFPDVITDGTPGTRDGSDVRIAFDQTVAGFDVNTVNEYLDGTGNKGGPLVTTTNKTTQSDLRLYTSDNNATMQRLSQSDDYFKGQCSASFRRMIETVPGGTRFTASIDPSTSTNLKPYNVDLNLDWKGNMVLSGNLRYIRVAGAAAAPKSYTVQLIDRNGKTTKAKATATKSTADSGTGIFGPTNPYPFQLKFNANAGISGISVAGQTFKFQDSMFVNIGMSSISPTPPAFNPTTAMDAEADYSFNSTVAVSFPPFLPLTSNESSDNTFTVPLLQPPRNPHSHHVPARLPRRQRRSQNRRLHTDHPQTHRQNQRLRHLLGHHEEIHEREAGVRYECGRRGRRPGPRRRLLEAVE